MERRKLIGITVAVVAVCGGGAAIAAIAVGSGSGSSGSATTAAITTTPVAPDTSGGGLGGGLYQGGGGGFTPGGAGGFRRGGRGGFGQNLAPAAAYLGVTTAALESDVQSGKTLASVAKAQGKSVDGLISAMVAAQKTQFDALVKSGRIPAAQAQQFESFMKQRVTDQVNGTRPSFPGGGGFGPGGDDGGSGSGGTGSFGNSSSGSATA